MIEYLKKVVKNNNIEDIYLTGFVDVENGIAQFCHDLRFMYFEINNKYIEFEVVEQFSKLKIRIVDSIEYNFEIDKDVIKAKSDLEQNEEEFKAQSLLAKELLQKLEIQKQKQSQTRIVAEKLAELKATLPDYDELSQKSILFEQNKSFVKRGADFVLKTEKTIADIESEIIREISRENGFVIATGGGAVLRPENDMSYGCPSIFARGRSNTLSSPP